MIAPDDAGAAVAAVILAHNALPEHMEQTSAMVAAAREAGCEPVIVVLPRGAIPPRDVRSITVAAGASTISAVRAGMAQLGNSRARHALLWPRDGEPCDAGRLAALVRFAAGNGATMSAFDGASLDRSPVVIARAAWLDLMTLGERGLDAVADRQAVRRLRD